MSKGQRNRQQSARERIAAQQAAARRAEIRRNALLFGGAVVVVIVVVVAFVVIRLNQSPAKSAADPVTGTALPASVTRNVTTVPVSALDAVGTGSVLSYHSPAVTSISGPALTSGGKPEMLYIGGEFCPYCAAMRWAMAVSLSQFGTLSPLHGIHSSSEDTDANTATLTFYKSTYTSSHLAFVPVENEDRNHKTLQPTTAAQQQLWKQYTQGQFTYPFIDFGNKLLISGPIYDAAVLKGLTWAQIAQQMRQPSSPVAQGILGSANFITASICKMTGGQPGNVCTAKGVTAASAHLG